MLPTYMMPSPTVSFVVSVIMGCVSAYYARGRGKNPYLWFGLGMLLGIFGVLLVFFLPSKKRRRTEQQPQEKVVTLDITPSMSATSKERFWYYLDSNNQQLGPMSYAALKKSFIDGQISQSTYIWNEELENWKVFGDIFDIPTAPITQ